MISSFITFVKTTRKRCLSFSSVDANKISSSSTFLKNIAYKIVLWKKSKCAWKYSKVCLSFMPISEFIRMRSRLPALKSTAAGSSINWGICNSIFKINIKIYNSLIIVRNRRIIYKIIAQIIFITIFLFKKDKNRIYDMNLYI